jgi:hypothetical protein
MPADAGLLNVEMEIGRYIVGVVRNAHTTALDTVVDPVFY